MAEVRTFTAGDGYVWSYRHYPSATSPPRATVVGIHGIQSHGGWYEGTCAALAAAGFDVFFLDRRGSGMNDVRRGDAPSFRRLLDDLAEFVTPLPRPRRLLAISWGGKLAAALTKRHPGLTDGLALLCPGFFAQVRPTFRERLRIVGSYLVAPDRLFPIPLNDPELFTASPEWQRFLRDDAKALHQATARLFVHSARLDGYLRFVPQCVREPVLLQLAGRDRIIDNERTRRFVEGFATKDKTIVEYPAAHHTLEFEPSRRWLDDLTAWLGRG